MPLFDLFGSNSDRDVGLKILKSYFNAATSYSGFKYRDFNEWIKWIESFDKGYPDFVGNLVKSNSYSTTVGQAQDRVKDLAKKSQGMAKTSDIIRAAGGTGSSINWSVAVPTVVAQTGRQVASGALQVAEAAKTGLFNTALLIRYLPWIGAGALGLYVYSMGRSTGKGFGRAAESVGSGIKEVSSAAARKISGR